MTLIFENSMILITGRQNTLIKTLTTFLHVILAENSIDKAITSLILPKLLLNHSPPPAPTKQVETLDGIGTRLTVT